MKEKNKRKIKTSQWFKTLSKLSESSRKKTVHRTGHTEEKNDVKDLLIDAGIGATNTHADQISLAVKGNRQQRRALVKSVKQFEKSKR